MHFRNRPVQAHSAYSETVAATHLARRVECCWTASSEQPVHGHAVRPDGCIDLLFSSVDGLRIVGAMTKTLNCDIPAGARTVGIRFRPGMGRALVSMPVAEITDLLLPAQEVLGRSARELESRLAAAASAEECMRIMSAAVAHPEEPANPVQRAIELITRQRGDTDLPRIASDAGLSTRQFRRRCLEESGLSPKQLCRILRFRHAMYLAGQTGQPEWAVIAVNAGYFDQAHMIRDFHEFGGGTPMSLLSNTL